MYEFCNQMIKIRKAEESDLPAILEIYNEIILNTTAVYDYLPHTLEMRQAWFNAKDKEGYPVFVATGDEVVLGFSTLGVFRQWAAYKYSVEHSLYVAHNSRGKGIGKLLMQPLITSAKEMGKHTMIAGIDSLNAASIKLHENFGFEKVAHFKEVGYKFTHWLDLVFYQLMLE